tara:strand:+ start:1058 stop:1546 length:489 start_codon:yes stop_codon:yes gene_type:complete
MNTTPPSIREIRLVGEKALRRSPDIEMERHRALSDLRHENFFLVRGYEDQAPYHLSLELNGATLFMHVYTPDEDLLTTLQFGLSALKRIIKDYFMMCESFYAIARSGDVGKIEAVDMGRRAIHNEGAEILLQMLEKYVVSDMLTARRLFTLICILHIRVTNL